MNDRPRFAQGGVVYRAESSDDRVPAFLSPGLHAFSHGVCATCGYPLVRFEPGGVEHLIAATGFAEGEGERVWAEIVEAHGGEENIDADDPDQPDTFAAGGSG